MRGHSLLHNRYVPDYVPRIQRFAYYKGFSPAAYRLLILSFSPYFHKMKGPGTPITMVTNANKLFPQPYLSVSYLAY